MRTSTTIFLLGMLVTLLPMGLAPRRSRAAESPGEVQARILPGGWITASIVLRNKEAPIRRILDDAQRITKLNPDVLTVEAHPQGECTHLKVSTRGATHPLVYQTKRCPTEDGWREDLLKSEDFTAFEAIWRILPGDKGITVQAKVRSKIDLPVPDFILHRTTRESLIQQLERLRLEVAKARDTTQDGENAADAPRQN